MGNPGTTIYLCFRHAVQRAVAGEVIVSDIDDFYNEEDIHMLDCYDCEQEEK